MLRPLQQLIERIYDAPSTHDVRDFLFTHRDGLPPARRDVAADEELVVVDTDGEAEIGMFIDDAVLQRLHATRPLAELSGANVADFWTALEGVSHFAYLAFNLQHDRGVSQLELELQAEVDKYVATLWVMRAQQPRRFPRELHPLLFERTRLDPRLDAAGRSLYRTANRYAARFCARLARELSSDRRNVRTAALSGLRRFYRLSGTAKLRLIEDLASA